MKQQNPKINGKHLVVDFLALLLLFASPAFSFIALFGSVRGAVAAIGGVLIGLLIGAGASWWRWRTLNVLTLTILSGLIFGGPLAVPRVTGVAFTPTLESLRLLVTQTMNGWYDLLTLAPPADSFDGPAVLPFVLGMFLALLSMLFAGRTPVPGVAILGPVLLLLVAILWGVHAAPLASFYGLFMLLVATIWGALLSDRRRRGRSENIIAAQVKTSRRARQRARVRALGALVMCVLGAGVALGGVNFLTPGQSRTILRDFVEPPLDLREYASPLAEYRHLMRDKESTDLFTVSGVPQGARVRLAAMDSYDGVVFNVSPPAGDNGFRHVGRVLQETPGKKASQLSTVEFSMIDFESPWVPTVGDPRQLTFTARDVNALSKNLYFNSVLRTALNTNILKGEDKYQVRAVISKIPNQNQLQGTEVAKELISNNTDIPDFVNQKATSIIADTKTDLDRIRTIEQHLRTDGFFSDGKDGLSQPGHRVARIARLLQKEPMIGDDEQYSVAMALMLRSLNIPSRVVMGFYPQKPDASSNWTIKGTDTHVWVEVPFRGLGWVPFDPTPPRDQVPQTDEPKPKETPKPQVLQPPDPPRDPSEVPPEFRDEEANKKVDNPWLYLVLYYAGLGFMALGLVLLPFIVFLFIKLVRARLRARRGRPVDRVANSWLEILDRAADLGIDVPKVATRREQAALLEEKLRTKFGSRWAGSGKQAGASWEVPVKHAKLIDEIVFSEGDVDTRVCDSLWQQVRQSKTQLVAPARVGYRLWVLVSPRSLLPRALRGFGGYSNSLLAVLTYRPEDPLGGTVSSSETQILPSNGEVTENKGVPMLPQPIVNPSNVGEILSVDGNSRRKRNRRTDKKEEK